MRNLTIAALSLVLAAPGIAAVDKQPPDRMPSEMTPTEIRAYNSDIERAHPYFITCRKTPVVGSLARKLRVCRTNEQWKESSARGNDNAADTLEAMRRAPVNSSN
jgi:hypothetical protein